ncbi:MAG: hypothetical protein IJB45_01585 [Clostridia bacterium]|nr:hypothetical protein [Clostridia bacterium]
MKTLFTRIIAYLTPIFIWLGILFNPTTPVEGGNNEPVPTPKTSFDEGEFKMNKYDIVVSPDGDDSIDGSPDFPLKTPKAAKKS